MRHITYIDTADGSAYQYITNELTLSAYQLAISNKHC